MTLPAVPDPGPDDPAPRDPDGEARRVLRAAWDPGSPVKWWHAFIAMAMAGNIAAPVELRAAGLAVIVALAGVAWRGRNSFPDGAVRRGVVSRSHAGEVVVRLDDGALWGFHVEPDPGALLPEGEVVTLAEPREGPVAVAVTNQRTGRLEGVTGRDCRLYRPASATYVVPAGEAGPAETLTREQAEAFLRHRLGLLRGPVKMSPRRRAVVAEVGSEPALELVEVDAVWGQRLRVRTADGGLLGWPIRSGVVLLSAGARVWATRPLDGLHVVLVVLTDGGRRAELVWPQDRAVAE